MLGSEGLRVYFVACYGRLLHIIVCITVQVHVRTTRTDYVGILFFTIRPGFMAQYGAVKRGTIRDCYFRDSEFVAYNEYIGTLRQEDRFRFGA